MRGRKNRETGKSGMRRLGTACLCLGLAILAPMEGLAGSAALLNGGTATASNSSVIRTASGSNALRARVLLRSASTGSLWEGWTGDLSFLDGSSGDGTQEKPYQISTKAELMGLSELAVKGMVLGESDGKYPGDYKEKYFELTKDIDLGGISWLPIGFYKTQAELEAGTPTAFCGHFDGNGHTVSNFRMYQPDWVCAGLFGAIRDAEIVNLTVKPGNTITVKEQAGILVGSAENSVIRDIIVRGTVKTEGTAGGVAGTVLAGSVLENCTADHVALDTGTVHEVYAGGIAGSAAGSLIADCEVNTGDTKSARIQGGGYVGGIVGFQNDTDIFNVHVLGTIGGAGSQSAGGVTGKYGSGKLKVARFEGEIASTGLGSASREGTFIGTHDTGFQFRYGTGAGDDLAYLYADEEEKIAAGICGCGIPEDNTFAYEDHIGFWHSKDNFYTLISGQNTEAEDGQYFYEELEEGVLQVIDTEEAVLTGGEEAGYTPDHYAPNSVGKPTRGYLVSVLQIDTTANGENYYDVAVLTARGPSAYSHTLNKSIRGAVAAGDVVTVVTAPNNTDDEKYQMEGVPTWTDAWSRRRAMTYQIGGTYQFTMPEHDTEIAAVYKKVAASVRVEPEEYAFQVVQERTGDRKAPSIVTTVKNQDGKLIARYLNGELEEGTQVQDVTVDAVVDQNNDVEDESVKWSVDDTDLILLKMNGDEDSEGYTKKSASLELNLEADFFVQIVNQVEKEQADKNYQYPIADTIYGNGVQGGVAVLTAQTRPAASFEGKPLTANCRIPVTFQIRDRTKVAAESSILDKTALEFTVTRRLSGDRKAPEETVNVSAPQTLTAAFTPDYFDKKDISWSVDDTQIIRVEAGAYKSGTDTEDYKNASVSACKDTKWIQDIMAADDAMYAQNPYAKRTGSGERTATVTVIADDLLGNRQTAACEATVKFVTVDTTKVLAENVSLEPAELTFDLVLTKTGPSGKPVLTWEGNDAQKLTAAVSPEQTEETIRWEYDSDLLSVSEDGTILPKTDANWITEAMKKYPYTAEQTATVTARAGNASATAVIGLKFRLISRTYSTSSGSSGGSGSSGSSGRGKNISELLGQTLQTSQEGAPEGSVTGSWELLTDGHWKFTGNGRTYAGEWAYIYNPYAAEGQEKTSWFYFDEDETMHTGWYQDSDTKAWFYLHPVSDGSQGCMETGWQKIEGAWYYFDGSGRMMTGWRWIDGRCYCLDSQSGRLYTDTVTPDGYTVDASGAWTEGGKVQTIGSQWK